MYEQRSIAGDPHTVRWLSIISSTNMHQELSCERRAAFLVPTVLSWNIYLVTAVGNMCKTSEGSVTTWEEARKLP